MLDDWGQATTESVKAWVALLKSGVPDTTTSNHPVCQFDLDNLVWSGAALKSSVSLKLWTLVEKDVAYNASGPEIFMAVLNKLQMLTACAVHVLIDDLCNKKIKTHPQQNVDTFGDEVHELAKRIDGSGSAP